MEFTLRNNILFSGKTMASNGRFSFTFIVPNDIDYAFGNGKISYYARNDSVDMTEALWISLSEDSVMKTIQIKRDQDPAFHERYTLQERRDHRCRSLPAGNN